MALHAYRSIINRSMRPGINKFWVRSGISTSNGNPDGSVVVAFGQKAKIALRGGKTIAGPILRVNRREFVVELMAFSSRWFGTPAAFLSKKAESRIRFLICIILFEWYNFHCNRIAYFDCIELSMATRIQTMKLITIMTGLAVLGCVLPTNGLANSVTLQFDVFRWTTGTLHPNFMTLPIDLAQRTNAINDVRISYSLVAHQGETCIYRYPDIVNCGYCDAKLSIYFEEYPNIRSFITFPGEGIEYTGDIEFLYYDCDYGSVCPGTTVRPEDWAFLEDGVAHLRFVEAADFLGLKCDESIDMLSVTVVVDFFGPSLANGDMTWGSLKASYR
jgi:hypothetical protein